MGAVLCCTEHTEMNIRQQDIDEILQGHNLITKIWGFLDVVQQIMGNGCPSYRLS